MTESTAQQIRPARAVSFTTVGLGVLLVFATLLVYWPAMHGGVLIDDADHITRREWRSWAGLARVWFDVGTTSQYFPLLHTAFWFESQLWQDSLLGYHLVNVLQHALSAFLMVALMRRRLKLPGAWFAGFVFALHPVCVESVAWISEQKNTLSTLFCLAAAYVYLGYDQQRRTSQYWIAFGLFVCALLTKSITATLVPVLLVIFWWQRGRIEWRRDVRPLLPWLIVGAAMGLFTAWYEQVYASARGASFDLSFLERSLIAGRAIVFYARSLLWPSDLMFINPRWSVSTDEAWQYVFPALVIGVAIILIWLARRHRGPLAAFLIYTGCLFPTVGFLNINWFNFSFVADHFQYLACIGFIIPAASSATRLVQWLKRERGKLEVTLSGILFVSVLALLSWRQSAHYRDAETLYRETISQNPASWLAHHNLGATLLDRTDRVEEAIRHLRTVLKLKPDHLSAHINLGYAYGMVPGRLPEAILAFEGALRLDPNNRAALMGLAKVFAHTPGRQTDAIATYRRALEVDPLAWEAHVGLASLLAATPGKLNEALVEYEAAIQLRPNDAALRNDFGGQLASAGRTQEAIAEFEMAVQLQPKYAEAHFNLGSLLADTPGRIDDALAHFEAALQLTPNDPAIHNNFGVALLQLPSRRNDAIREFRKVVELAPGSAEGHFGLGQALLGQPDGEHEALRHFERAVQLRPNWEAAQRAVTQLRARTR